MIATQTPDPASWPLELYRRVIRGEVTRHEAQDLTNAARRAATGTVSPEVTAALAAFEASLA